MKRRRYELTDFEWSIIQPLLPNKPRGVPRADDRKVTLANVVYNMKRWCWLDRRSMPA